MSWLFGGNQGPFIGPGLMMCFCCRWPFAEFCDPFKNDCEIDLRADMAVESGNCQAQKRSFKNLPEREPL